VASIVYSPHLSAEGEPFLSLRKPREFWERITRAQGPVAIVPKPATLNILSLAHLPEYVKGVLAGSLPNGFGSHETHILLQVLAANGAMVTAVETALRKRTGVCAPVSGFHRAGWDYAGGFCTFNGLLVAERAARARGWLRAGDKVLIYDGDGHRGDGCVDIIEKLNLQAYVRYVGRQEGIDDARPIEQLRELAKEFQNFALVLYQAGADAYSGDPFGVGYLTKAELEERDRTVFNACAVARIPLVWNLAGGFHETATVLLHEQTWEAFTDEYRRAEQEIG